MRVVNSVTKVLIFVSASASSCFHLTASILRAFLSSMTACLALSNFCCKDARVCEDSCSSAESKDSTYQNNNEKENDDEDEKRGKKEKERKEGRKRLFLSSMTACLALSSFCCKETRVCEDSCSSVESKNSTYHDDDNDDDEKDGDQTYDEQQT